MRGPVYLAIRALGLIGIHVHDWYYYAVAGEHMISTDHRVCRIAVCQRHEVWSGRWTETRVGAPGI